MAIIKKTTIRRYNGTDWDSIYLSTASDIVALGKALTVADEVTGYAKDDVISATVSVYDILQKVINRLQYVDKTIIPDVKTGNGIAALAASKITGVLTDAQLPADVHGNVFTGVTDSAKDNISGLKVGDIVKTTEGKVYGCQAINNGVPAWVALSDDAATVAWSRVTGRPTTVTNTAADAADTSKLYLTNVVLTGDLVETASAANEGKVMKINAAGKLDTSITGDADTVDGHDASYFATQSWADDIDAAIGDDATANTIKGRIAGLEGWQSDANTALNLAQVIAGTGTLPLAIIPKGAQERLYKISTISVLADTSAEGYPVDASNGDTIQAVDTGIMYYVIDDTKLGTSSYADGINVYTAGTASSVAWANVTGKPTTLDGYGIIDAVYSNEKVTSATAANAGKILVLNASGKLDVDITGDADTLDGHDATYFAVATDFATLETRVGLTDATGLSKRIADLETTVGDAASGLVKAVADNTAAIGDDTTGSETGIYRRLVDLEAGTTIAALAASKLTGTVARANLPADVSGKAFSKTDLADAQATLPSTSNVNNGDLVVLSDGKVYMVTDSTQLNANAGYTLIVDPSTQSIAWSQLTGKPTTIIKTGTAAAGQILLSNAIITDDVVTDGINASTDAGDTGKSGKLVAVGVDGKVKADVTHLGGHAASYYASNAYVQNVALSTLKEYASTADVQDAEVNQMILVPVTE